MKKVNIQLLLVLFTALALGISSCSKDEDPEPTPTPTAPTMESIAIEGENTVFEATVQFSEGVYANNDKTGNLDDASLNVTLTGGIAGFESYTVTHSAGESTATVNIVLDALPDGTEELTVAPASATSIYNGAGTAMSETESQKITLSGITFEPIVVSENITENSTWKTGFIYILGSRVSVVSGVTLTIEPGVVIKGEAGTGANATALIIARGGTLLAEGTADQPIIFTSVADEIEPGQVASPNLDATLDGLWGGLIVLGYAPISADAVPSQIEGIPPSDQNGLYGGDNAADNSGVIKFVSIRHGGANIGEGNEINGLTLGGVGSGTVIENVEIVSNQDDGIEWFGGTVNVKNALVWNTGDDAIDTDQSWGGTLDNFVIINPGDECFELDGPEAAMEATHTLKNGSVMAGDAEGLADLDDNSLVNMMNIYFFDLAEGQDFDLVPAGLSASDFEATIPEGYTVTDFFIDGSDSFVTEVAAGANTVGADLAQFNTWSWAAVSGALDDF
ncbi:MAG: hypothetical protein R2750_08820 [Bacteroidales bacterium]